MSADSGDDDEGQPLSQTDEGDLINNGFVMNRTMDHAADAAAQESLIRILEAGPCVLEGVKEAAGASKVILAGEVTSTSHVTSHVCGCGDLPLLMQRWAVAVVRAAVAQ